MGEQLAFAIDDGLTHDTNDPDLSFTPEPVARQGCEALAEVLGIEPSRVLDPSAGGGVFGKVARDVWPQAELHGVEPRESERDSLARHYDHHHVGFIQDAPLPGWHQAAAFDLVVTNPPFSCWVDVLGSVVPYVQGFVAFLGLSTWGQSSDQQACFQHLRPHCQLRVVGRVHFRGPGINPRTGKRWGADQRDVSWWVWRIEDRPPLPSWFVRDLPELPPAARRWTERPGSA